MAVDYASTQAGALVHRRGSLEVQEVAGVRDDVQTRAGREVTLGVADEPDVEAAVAIPVAISSARIRA